MNTRLALLAASFAVLLTACARQERAREVEWAKAALARNPALEILSTDEVAGVFTVRDNTNGTLYRLPLGELIAAPPPRPVKPASAPAAPLPATVAPEPASPASEPAASQTTEPVLAARPRSGDELVEGPGYSISRGQPTAPPPSMEGPGYSITREEPVARASEPRAEAVASNVEKRNDPIICQGDRLMRIDGETIEFSGDAVIAEKGCDLYISNARIRAGGVGIIARQARVHIVNSTIGGSRGSYEASEGAEIYVARSTFSGIGRRFDSATMNDLGGNEYQLHH
jgi:hypothetical protein